MKSLKMKLIYRKHKKAILGTLGAVLLAGLVFFFSYFHVTKVEVMGTSRYTDEHSCCRYFLFFVFCFHFITSRLNYSVLMEDGIFLH